MFLTRRCFFWQFSKFLERSGGFVIVLQKTLELSVPVDGVAKNKGQKHILMFLLLQDLFELEFGTKDLEYIL